MSCRVVVTGLGIIAPGAKGAGGLWDLISSGHSAIGQVTRFDASRLPCAIAGEVPDFDPGEHMDRKASRRAGRAAQLAVGAARAACLDAGLDLSRTNPGQVGIFEGTSLGPLNCTLESYRSYLSDGCRHINPTVLMSGMMGSGSGCIALELGIHGPSLTISDGSVSSAYAIGYGYRHVQSGNGDIAIAGGAEAPLSEELVETFCCARLLSTRNDIPREAVRPFDKERDGFVLGEGAAFLILEDLKHALERGASIYGEIAGFGETTDAYHPTSPDPTGTWIARAMELALREGRTAPEEVQYLNAHGTATRVNDPVETRAIKTVFGGYASTLSVSSTKPYAGHLLGACGGLEAAITLLSIRHGFIPATLNLASPDEECDLDYVPGTGRYQRVDAAMSNNYSFGGRNASLLFKRFSDT